MWKMCFTEPTTKNAIFVKIIDTAQKKEGIEIAEPGVKTKKKLKTCVSIAKTKGEVEAVKKELKSIFPESEKIDYTGGTDYAYVNFGEDADESTANKAKMMKAVKAGNVTTTELTPKQKEVTYELHVERSRINKGKLGKIEKALERSNRGITFCKYHTCTVPHLH
jgi:predicted XRE-type DNA-binding protein